MGKHSTLKPAKRPPQQAADTPNTLAADTIAVLVVARDAIETSLNSGVANPALIRELGGISRALQGMLAEQRAAEKAAAAARTSVTQEEVLAFLRALPRSELDALVSKVTAPRRSVLS